MFNLHLHRKNEKQRSQCDKFKDRFERTNKIQEAKKNTFTSQSIVRTTQWVKNNLHSKGAEIIEQGVSSMKHPDKHEFRDYKPVGNIYLRNYIPEKLRVLLSHSNYFHGHYIPEIYNPDAPNVRKVKWLKPRAKEKESAHKVQYAGCDENSRVERALQDATFLNEPIDTRLISDPQWRFPNKNKFSSPQGFVTRLRTQFSGRFDSQAWPVLPNYHYQSKYIGGISETGDISRKRDKEREVSTASFNSSNPADTWKNRLNSSSSIRTFTAEKAIKYIENESLQSNVQGSSGDLMSCLNASKESKRHSVSSGIKHVRLKTSRDSLCNSKLYKKSLENYYFEYNSHPKRAENQLRQSSMYSGLNQSSANILHAQLSSKHWTSDFNRSPINIPQEIEILDRVRTPIENLTPHQDLHKLSAMMRSQTSSFLHRPSAKL